MSCVQVSVHACICICIYSVQFSCSVVSDSLWPHESHHARTPRLSPAPRVYSDSRPSSQWCHPAISSSVVPFPSCPQSLSASGSFPMSQLFTWGGQSIGVSASASVLPMNTQDRSRIYWMQINIYSFPGSTELTICNWKNECNLDYIYLDIRTFQGRCSSRNLMKFNATKPTRHILKRMYRF